MSNLKSNFSGGPGPAGDPKAPSYRAAAKGRSGSFKRTPRDFLDMFLERWWIGALAGGVAAALIVIFRPHFEPLYRSEVTLLFETKKQRVLAYDGPVDQTVTNPSELATHMEQLKSNTFTEYVLQSFTPEERDQITKPYVDPLKPEVPVMLGDVVRPNVYVYPRKGTPIVGIVVTNRSPQAAALIANRYAEKYIEYKLDSANTQTNTALMFLQTQAESLRKEVEDAQKRLRDYRQKYNLAAFSETQNLWIQKLAEINRQRVKAASDEIEAKFVVNKIDDYLRDNRNLMEIPPVALYGKVTEYDTQVRNLQTTRTILSDRYDEKHPKMLQNDLDMREAQRLLKEAQAFAIADARARFERASQYVKRLDEETIEIEKQTRELDRISTEYKILAQNADETNRSYSSVTTRLSETKITEKLKLPNISVFDPAGIPYAPSDTGIAAVTMKASVAGIGLLLIIPLGLGLFDTRIRTPVHVEEALQEPLLGAVKRMRKMGETQRAQVFRLQKDRDLAEAYLGIFSEVEMRSSLGFPKTLLITSSVPAEGKSLLSSNLAAVFASHKRRTLLVDCDLRRPTLHRYFGVKVETGWVQWLETPPEMRPSAPVGIVAITDDLHLLPAGRSPHNPTELLDRLSRRETLQPLLQNYDLVIFDTPPAAVFPDALLLARSCHEMIYVCRYRSVRLAVVRKVLDRFVDAGISSLGVVLNHLPETKARSYGYHGYGTQSAAYYKAYSEKSDA